MPTQLIAPGITEAVSASVTVPAGESAMVFLIAAPGSTDIAQNAYVQLQFQGSNGAWSTQHTLSAPGNTAVRFDGPVVYRLRREGRQPSVGADRA